MADRRISVLIADDTSVAREGLRAMLETGEDIQVVGETDSVFSILRLVQELSPDILIIDLKWYGDESAGWIKIREVKKESPEIKIIGQTAYESLIVEARKAGADEVVTKQIRRNELLDLIRNVFARKIFTQSEDFNIHTKANHLSPRELEVINLMAKGLSDKEISGALNIKSITAKNHVKNIMQKLGATNRTQAVAKAQEAKLLSH